MSDFYSSGWNSVPNGGAKYRLHLVVNVAGQNVAANQTTLSWALYIEKDRSYQGFYDYWADWAVAINGAVVGTQTNVQNPTSAWTGWSAHLVGSGSTTVTNGTDGSLPAMGVAASWSRTGGGGPSGYAPGPMSLSTTMSVPVIQRATQPSVTPSPATVGSTVTIDLPRASGSYTHNVTWVSGNLSGTIGTGLGASTTWTVPSVMGEFPGEDLGPIVITVDTRFGGNSIGTKQVTLLARNAPVAPIPRTPDELADESRQFDVRARLVTFDGGEWLARSPIPADTITLVDPSSATATCSISLSKLNIDTGDFPEYGIVDVDIFNGDDWLYTNHRFVLSRVTDDDVDPTKASTYSGTEYVDFMMGLAYVQEDYFWDGSTNHAAPTTPGAMLRYAFLQAKARGWGPRMGITWGDGVTSAGEPWINTAVSRTYSKGTPISQMLDGMVEDGLVEYSVRYRGNSAELMLYNPGTGRSFADAGASPVVNLGLAPLTRAPRRGTIEKRLTRVTVVGDTVTDYGNKGTATDNTSTTTKVTREKAPFDPDVFGHLEGWVTASGITRDADAGTIADNALRDNASAVNERTFEYDTAGTPPQFFPYHVFRPGDWVLIPDGANTVTDRINQITIDKQIDSRRMTVLTGDRILSGTASLAKRQNAMTGGSINGGNGMSPSPLDSRIPKAPVIETIEADGYWNPTGAARSAVTITWTPVLLALSGAKLSVDLYEVYSRPANLDGAWTLRSSTAQPQITTDNWGINADLEFRVRARSTAGVYGEFSENWEITTVEPDELLGAPSDPIVASDAIGNITATWNGLIDADVPPPWFNYARAEISDEEHGAYTVGGGQLTAAGDIIIAGVGAGDWWVRLVGYDTLNRAGDRSNAIMVTVTPTVGDNRQPKAPEGVAVTSLGYWDGASAESGIIVEWDAVTEATDDTPIGIKVYEVWIKLTTDTTYHQVTDVDGATTEVAIAPLGPIGAEIDVVVVAVATNNERSDFSVSETVTLAGPDAPLDPPSNPELNSRMGIIGVAWDGDLRNISTDEAYVAPPYISHIDIEVSVDDGDTFQAVGFLTRGARTQTIGGITVGTTVQVRLVAVDILGNRSDPSDEASILVVGITGPDIEANAITANHIMAGSIQVSHVSPSFGDDLNLSANGTITLISGQVADVQTQADSNADAIALQRTRYDFTPDEALISQPGSVFQVAISNTQMEFRESGVARAWLNAGVFNAPQLATLQLLFPKHIVMDNPDGTGFFRAGS